MQFPVDPLVQTAPTQGVCEQYVALLYNTDALRDSWLPAGVPGSQEQQQAGVEFLLL